MPTFDWQASVDDVAVLLRERTRFEGAEVGTFNANTRPTDTQVGQQIDMAADVISAAVGQDIPGRYWARARVLVALRAAQMVELSFFASEVAANRSPYQALKDQFDEDLPMLVKAVGESGLEEPADANLRPQGGFGPPATAVSGTAEAVADIEGALWLVTGPPDDINAPYGPGGAGWPAPPVGGVPW